VSGALAIAFIIAILSGCEQREESKMMAAMETPYPRIAMLWRGAENGPADDFENLAQHDLVMVSPGRLGMVWDREPYGLAEGFTPESVEVARGRVSRLRELNPRIVIVSDLLFYEYIDNSLPEDHPWWLRINGERQQFWPGTHRMDWYNPEYRTHVVRQSIALMESGVDGIFFDNLRDEPDAWVPFLTELREAVGDGCLIFANTGYAVSEYDFAAPFVNGFMYESGWSHGRTDWDDTVKAMQHTTSLTREPRINLIERFEETRSHAGWPGDKRRGERPERDPAARRWSLCYALTIGDYYYLFADNTSHRHDWYPEYDVKIGLPVAVGERIGSRVWQRQYEKALVVVNLPGAQDVFTLRLDAAAKDVFTGESGSEFDIAPADGRILVMD
jgi:hypothetical protein